MIAAGRLALRLVRLGGARAALSAGLVGVGVVVGTILLTLALGGVHGWDARDARVGWRADLTAGGPPSAAAADPVARTAATVQVVAGRAVTVVDLAATAPPPGLDRVPAPAEVFVSPALADLPLPPELVPTGEIGDAGLRGPGELVAYVGRAPDDPALEGAAVLGSYAPTGAFGLIDIYRQLTQVAAALLVFPVAGLLGASARLTAARRAEQLALLRLLGASTRQITVAATAEVTAVATVAALAGVVLYWLGAPLAALIELDGTRWFAADVRPEPLVLLGIVAGVALLATAASVSGLRQVVVSPLGVARRSRPGAAGPVRLLGVAAGVGVFVALTWAQSSENRTGLVFGGAVLAMFGAALFIGPLVVRLLGASMVRSARTPAALLAGRRLLDDPKGAFRPLSGLVLAVFVAGFLAPLTASIAGDTDGTGAYLVEDLQRGALVVLAGTFAIAATASGTAAAARVLDHRRSLRLLVLAGTPLGVLDAARRAETVRPLAVCGVVALVLGVGAASPFAAAADTFSPSGLVVLGGALVVGVGLVTAASAVSRPLLAAVTSTDGLRE